MSEKIKVDLDTWKQICEDVLSLKIVVQCMSDLLLDNCVFTKEDFEYKISEFSKKLFNSKKEND